MNYYYSLIRTEDFDLWKDGKLLLKFLDPQKRDIEYFTKNSNYGNSYVIPYEICKPEEKPKDDNHFITFQEYCEEIKRYNIGTNTPISFKGDVGVVIGYFIDD